MLAEMPTAADVFYYILLPFAWLLELVVWIVRLILAPFLLIFRVLFHTFALPFRFLAKFEALGYYFGVATVCGLCVGIVMHFAGHFIQQALGLDRDDAPPSEVRSWSELSRKRRRKREEGLLTKPLSAAVLNVPTTDFATRGQLDRLYPKSPSTLMSTSILEEDDTSDES